MNRRLKRLLLLTRLEADIKVRLLVRTNSAVTLIRVTGVPKLCYITLENHKITTVLNITEQICVYLLQCCRLVCVKHAAFQNKLEYISHVNFSIIIIYFLRQSYIIVRMNITKNANIIR